MLKRIVTLIIGAVGFLWLSLLSGCGSGCGDIEDEVFIQKALEHFIASQRETPAYSSDDSLVVRPNEIYTSVEEFRAENPNCCSFGYRGTDGFLPEWWARVNNDYEGTVIIRYNARVVYEGETREEARSGDVYLNSCGEIIHSSKLWP